MGGMIARYAAGLLYRPADGTLAGLAPRHFVTLASPHLGLTVDVGPAQVPFVAWAAHLPLLGGPLQRGLQAIGHTVAARVFRGTGRHFLALDGGPGELPLLMCMALDEPDKGRFFYSALRAFRTRACYGNVGRDHWVSWQNATLRDTAQLPHLEPELVRRGRGVVHEDPPQAAWSSGAGLSGGGGGRTGADAAAAAAVAAAGYGVTEGACEAKAEAEGAGRDVQRKQTAAAETVAATTAGSEQPRTESGGQGGGGAGVGEAAGAAACAAQVAMPKALAGDAAAAEAQAQAQAQAQAAADAADVELEEQLTAAPESPAQVVSFALERLQQLPWRRVDVSFAGAHMGTAHNNIQATRWTNTVGAGVLRHLRQHLEAMELYVAAESPGRV
ncbi:hypothetical protein HYH02_004001 [Chlamydomonas schloesseri]|nr:hypothetical protein HYH02_004001 [Chlamydomonas schloesseri]|eukprot:KAG2451401.1 hypothetical protein HYH02_004001 [Chlamydomonas schloesseri]